MSMRRKARHISTSPGEKRRLIDRRKVAHAIAPRAKMFRCGIAVIGKALWEGFGKDVDVFGVAIMEQVPDDIDSVFAAGLDKWVDRAEIILSPPIYQRPAHRFARSINVNFVQPLVIFVHMFVMMRCANLVDPLASGIVAGGAFESREEKATKHMPSFPPGRRPNGQRA